MQFIVITGPTYFRSIRRIAKALQIGDGIELRIDYFKEITNDQLAEIINLCRNSNKKIIFTLRSKDAGGNSDLTTSELEEKILSLAQLKPDYIDIEHHLSNNLFQKVKVLGVKIIASHHDFIKTPLNLSNLLDSMMKKDSYCYKICTRAKNIHDSFRMIKCIHNQKDKDLNFIGLCMGGDGDITRKDGLSAGNYLNYKIMHIRDKVSEGINFA